MSKFVEVSLTIEVRNDEEANAVLDSVFNGSAAEFVRMGALYGNLPIGRGLYGNPSMDASTQITQRKREDAEVKRVEVKRVETKAGQSETKPTAPVKEHVPVATGLMGLRRRERR